MREYIPVNKGPAVVKGAKSSNLISDSYKDAITIAYQYIGSKEADVTFDFCGQKLYAPIMAGPVGGQNKVMDDGILHYARAVREASSIFWADYHSPEVWGQILAEGIPALRVIKPLADLEKIKEEIRHDEEGGAVAFAMDIDHGITVYGKNDQQKEAFAPKTIEELKSLAECTKLPFYLKGILSVSDALAAKQAGAKGIVISAHNNRFPCAVPALKILPSIREAVGDEMEVLIDGGFNNGYDVFKALALGADAVLCAKAFMASFAKDKEEGLTVKILEMGAELKGAMSNTGSIDLKHINKNAIILP